MAFDWGQLLGGLIGAGQQPQRGQQQQPMQQQAMQQQPNTAESLYGALVGNQLSGLTTMQNLPAIYAAQSLPIHQINAQNYQATEPARIQAQSQQDTISSVLPAVLAALQSGGGFMGQQGYQTDYGARASLSPQGSAARPSDASQYRY
jgi:hypothetical protein